MGDRETLTIEYVDVSSADDAGEERPRRRDDRPENGRVRNNALRIRLSIRIASDKYRLTMMGRWFLALPDFGIRDCCSRGMGSNWQDRFERVGSGVIANFNRVDSLLISSLPAILGV